MILTPNQSQKSRFPRSYSDPKYLNYFSSVTHVDQTASAEDHRQFDSLEGEVLRQPFAYLIPRPVCDGGEENVYFGDTKVL